MKATLHHGDCLDVLKGFKANSVAMVFTSPPYGRQRAKQYGGVAPDDYVDWFLPIAAQLKRVLKPTGSFFLNIKEPVVQGERHPYVLELVLALRGQGWRWTEEYIWRKLNVFPMGSVHDRFKDAFERVHQFTLRRDFTINRKAMRVRGTGRASVASKPSSDTASGYPTGGFSPTPYNCDLVFPDNVVEVGNSDRSTYHPASFPIGLPSWFIRAFSNEGDTILDPFAGSAMTLLAAVDANRNAIGVELDAEYHANASRAIERRLSGTPTKDIYRRRRRPIEGVRALFADPSHGEAPKRAQKA